ncbi:hypothetical protein [Paenibacillus wenxiniae]|uniref:Uncharacterized protein n=1 Tax=Paenibacillus wenxiniae TaxID=1636843 RepID=A0ABW4RLH1_9BACL
MLQNQYVARLRADERYMINTLFYKKKGTVFTIRSIVIPDFSNPSLWFRLDYYFARFDQWFYHLAQWSKLIQKQYGYSELPIHTWRRDSLIYSSYAVALFLQMYGMEQGLLIDSSSITSFIPYWMGLFASLAIWIGMVFLGSSILIRYPFVTQCLSWFSNNSTLNGLKKIAAVIIIFNLMMQLVREPSTVAMQWTALAIVVCIVVSYCLPVHALRIPIDLLKQQLMHGGYQHVTDPKVLEWLLQASIVMKCGHTFLTTHPQIAKIAAHHTEYAMLAHAHLMVQAVEHIDTSVIAFANYEEEYSEYYEYGPEDITVWREQSVSRARYYMRHGY